MGTKRSLVEVVHDTGYGDALLMHINHAFGSKDMRAEAVHEMNEIGQLREASGKGKTMTKNESVDAASMHPIVHPPFVREVVRQWMQREMSDISEDTIFAAWECGLEFRLWRAVQALPEPHEYCGTVIDAERIERLRDVAEWLGEWQIWCDADGVIPVPLDVWKSEMSVG